MRNRIHITNVKFRVAGVGPRQVSKNDKTQKRTPPSDETGEDEQRPQP